MPQEAFAGDDVVGEFMKEKAEEEEKDKPKVTDLTLPGELVTLLEQHTHTYPVGSQLGVKLLFLISSGWGSWGGLGTKPPKKKVVESKPPPPQRPRKDKGLSHVIISEERDKKAAKHQVLSPCRDGLAIIVSVNMATCAPCEATINDTFLSVWPLSTLMPMLL